jgi:hypothetical protein
MRNLTNRYLYRITPLRHVVDLFESRELHFAPPGSWDDPYERILQHRDSAFLFAQCWCKRAVSDAMWRIYSSDKTCVRVRTSLKKLEGVGARIRANYNAMFRVSEVQYGRPKFVDGELARIAAELANGFSRKRAMDALFLKRDAFDYESEVRAVALLKPDGKSSARLHLRVRIDPHDFIESVLFDPRADETYTKMASHYLREVLGFRGQIARSTLYRAKEVRIPHEA